MSVEPVLYDPAADTLLVEVRPWPAASPEAINDAVGGEQVEDGLVIHYGPDGLPHAFEIEHASARPAPSGPGTGGAARSQGLRGITAVMRAR